MKRKIACITLDMERDHGDPEGQIRLLGNPGFFERYVGIIQRHNVKVTMFTVTSLFDEFGDAFKKLAAQFPLEYAVHSHSHDPGNACGRNEIEASQKAFLQFTGRAPLGYRAPMGQINKEGFGHLIDLGYAYDSSVYTSFRPGKFGYFNLNKPNVPFRVRNGKGSLMEFPFTSISTVRIPFALSYVKLVGWAGFSTLLKAFSLPDVVVALSHPYDFYFHQVAGGIRGLERIALSRNAHRGFEYFEKMVLALKARGYEFLFMSELYDDVKKNSNPPEVDLTDWS